MNTSDEKQKKREKSSLKSSPRSDYLERCVKKIIPLSSSHSAIALFVGLTAEASFPEES